MASRKRPAAAAAAAAALLALLLALSNACAAWAQNSGQGQPDNFKEPKTGALVLVNDHEGNDDFALFDDSAKKLHPLPKGKKPPKKDKNGKTLKLGDVVTIVMMVDAPTCGNATAETTVDALRAAYLGPALDGKGGVAYRAEMCSYGELMISVPAFTVIRITPSCTWDTTTCDWSGIYSAAIAAAPAALKAAASPYLVADFTNYHIVIRQDICRWSGLATMGSNANTVWLKPGSIVPSSWQVPMQEMIHNFVMYHSYGDGSEYNDYTSFMGSGNACPNAKELALLGWASPATGGLLDGTSIAAGAATGPIMLPATYLTGAGAYARVKPTWMSSYTSTDPTTGGKNLYFEVRKDGNADASIIPSFVNALIVHQVIAYMDNDQATYRSDNAINDFVTFIAPNTRTVISSWNIKNYNLVVYTGSMFGSQGAILPVYFCRFVTAETGGKAKPGERAPPLPPMTPDHPPPTSGHRPPPRRSPPRHRNGYNAPPPHHRQQMRQRA
ncbi:hypothetical protein HXX76_002282 [Chlamydomonas incerta]|uniref:Peptidase M11 gametolysin domain-containing protein n=1 Tax=Chlamydomonas incerta TaxID=51695 RepID=A0A835WAR4_CHLIN|nr:hypothetical protein HXX76_002282 [Chlamydomonas incerta]|eukprot:KAG2443943.1 hypothetical protein HXX76_002282 [Chlamydomonas incerta]